MENTVLVVGKTTDEAQQYFYEHQVNVILCSVDTLEQFIKTKGQIIDAIVFPDVPFHSDLLKFLPNVKIIARSGVGIDNLPLREITEHGIIVTNTSGVNATSVAELTVGLMIELTRHIGYANRRYHQGINRLYEDVFTGSEISGKTIGLIGYGHIAKKVEQILNAFGADVLVANRTPREIRYGCQVTLTDLLTNSDIISLHVPLTDETSLLIGSHELQLMQNTALLVNTARGGLVDEQALSHALTAHQISGAAIDTLTNEPVLPTNQLLDFDNVIVTPHIGSQTTDTITKTAMMVANQVCAYLNHNEIRSGVNQNSLT
jgi:D-3-phosphoglycerate dehydrogenase